MPTRSSIVLEAALALFKPVARMLLRHGVAYPAFSTALKRVFLEAAVEELARTGQKQTDSAVSLLSGVHRRDVRQLLHAPQSRAFDQAEPMNMASQVAARWLSDPAFRDARGRPRVLPRAGEGASFDQLVASISSDVRPRAVLDELARLGMAEEADAQVRLLVPGFVPKQGFGEMATLLRDNLHDHAAAATLNLEGEHNYLEQSVYVDELTAESADKLHAAAARAWRQAFQTVMREAQERFDHDQANAPVEQRVHRARFGAYFYAADDHDRPT